MDINFCTYTEKDSDGYGTTYQTNCNKPVYYPAPDEIGICFAPLPTDNDCKYCTYCGREIVVN